MASVYKHWSRKTANSRSISNFTHKTYTIHRYIELMFFHSIYTISSYIFIGLDIREFFCSDKILILQKRCSKKEQPLFKPSLKCSCGEICVVWSFHKFTGSILILSIISGLGKEVFNGPSIKIWPCSPSQIGQATSPYFKQSYWLFRDCGGKNIPDRINIFNNQSVNYKTL